MGRCRGGWRWREEVGGGGRVVWREVVEVGRWWKEERSGGMEVCGVRENEEGGR